MGAGTYHLVTLGCPKNQVDSDKLEGVFAADGLAPVGEASDADLIVVNTCAFIDEARRESVDTVLALADERREGARLVVTGCLAERYGDDLDAVLPEVDRVAGFGVPVTLGRRPAADGPSVPSFDLLNLPRPPSSRPWAYVKVAEGCDRACGFCAIPSFRGPQRSRSVDSILEEVDALAVSEIVLVAQDLASFGRDQGVGERAIVPLVSKVGERVDRVRLLYLYPSDLTDGLIDAVLGTGVAYFDLSLQHVSRPLLRRMRRWGDGDRFRESIGRIRSIEPGAVFRSNFIVGYPGETEEDHDSLLAFVEEVGVDWCGFFAYSEEEGTWAADLDGGVPEGLVAERLSELGELQDGITSRRRDDLIGAEVEVLVDEPGVGRTWREAPEIDGIVVVPTDLPVGGFSTVTVTGALGPDLEAA
ncbi:MAG: 30S ribosomal protein S12 methylthiotransferase RimO [Actinobacteria bacterium]|nr:30S ribosomal protein S12 methylthiotransferase RimO [Actinomycetota bacterium]